MNPRALPVLDPSDHEFSRNPFPFYDTLRELAPITPILLSNGTTAWFVTTASAARAVLLDSRFSAIPPVKDRRPERAGLENHMLNTDAPEHTRLRRLVTATFSTARIDALTPRIEQIADDLLSLLDNDAEERRPVDLVDRYAFPLPVAVMCEVLGVPIKDREGLRSWTYTVSAPKTSVGVTSQNDAWANMHGYFTQLISHKRQQPSDDLFSELTHAHDSEGALSTEELLSMAFLLLFAGYETTMNLISGAASTLAGHPAEAARLAAASNDEWDTAVEELLRYVSPLEGATWRFAATDIEVAGVTVPAGSSVMVSLAAANHDPHSFAQPHTFKSGREPNRHLAFGYGPHHCVGARLARIEGRVALSRLIARYPSLRLVDESNSLRWRPGLLVRGPSQFPVQLGDPIKHLANAQQNRAACGLDRTITVRGPNSTLLDLASNDYLGLSRHPQVIDAGIAALTKWGAGSTGSRLVTGSLDIHRDLEHSLADHIGAESALVFSSGYLANLGLITSLVGSGDLIVSDELNHASIVDACRLSRARVAVSPHCDPDAVEKVLRDRDEDRAIVVTDAVFSVDGDTAPLASLAVAARRCDALLVVDDAHGLGVVAEAGRGTVFAAGLAGQRDVLATATLSKSLGSQGGVIFGPGEVIHHVTNTARSFIFDTGLAPASAGTAAAALQILHNDPSLAQHVRRRALEIFEAARACGLTTTTPTAAVCSIFVDRPSDAVTARDICRDHGVLVGCFRPPSVPDSISRLRLTARANLTDEDISQTAGALGEVARFLSGIQP